MVIGITGNFGVGKTTVTNMFRRLGARVIDADRIAHTIIRPKAAAYKQIIAYFGKKILLGSYISRKRLAREVFSGGEKLKRLNKIMHPKILRIIKERIKKISDREILVIDAALLIESGLSRTLAYDQVVRKYRRAQDLLPWVDKLIVVKSEPKIQMQRLKRSGLTVRETERRLNTQLAQDKKIGLADFVIDNSGSRSQTQKQVRKIWNKIGGGKWKN
jgi:dephospho-CoA kinase